MNLYLAKISDEVKSGEIQPPVTTREFLSWFGAQRRGYAIVRQIRRELERYNLFTTPDFESNYIDAPLYILPIVRLAEPALEPDEKIEVTTLEVTEARANIPGVNSDWVPRDPTYRIIADRFSSEDLAGVRDPSDAGRKIQSPDDLAFGEYLRLLEKPERWEQFGLAIDRVSFCRDLDSIRQIRNDVMHFDSDGVLPRELDSLRDFKTFLNQIQNIISPNEK